MERTIPVYSTLRSTWPVGSGVLVEDGIAYAAAGIANHDGTHVYALDAVTGKLRKTGVLVRDAPGFVVNRVLTRMTRVLMDALERGSPVDETDEAILRLGMPMAPSVLLAMVGPRVANHVLE